MAAIVDWVTDELRAGRTASSACQRAKTWTISLVTNEPWGAYNWYDGNLHSRIEVNTDLPVRATASWASSPTRRFPGHHLEHATKEQRLVREQGRYESSVQLINTPEALHQRRPRRDRRPFRADEERAGSRCSVGICERAGIAMTPPKRSATGASARAFDRLRGAGRRRTAAVR